MKLRDWQALRSFLCVKMNLTPVRPYVLLRAGLTIQPDRCEIRLASTFRCISPKSPPRVVLNGKC